MEVDRVMGEGLVHLSRTSFASIRSCWDTYFTLVWFQIWTLCSSDGALLSCEPYCGNSTKIPKVLNNQGPDVVLGLVAKANVSKGSQVYFDNLFTSMPLLDILSNKGENLFSVICFIHNSKKETSLKFKIYLGGDGDHVHQRQMCCCVARQQTCVHGQQQLLQGFQWRGEAVE